MTKKEILALSDSKLNEMVHIQGTKFDRKRKIDAKTATRMSNLLEKGKTPAEIAEKYNCTVLAVRENTDPEYKKARAARRKLHPCPHTGIDHITEKDRIAYKRKLVMAGAKGIY